jgi:dTMP kinase
MFIVFEGPEGAGKSTQLRRLEAHLRAQGRAVTATREPGGTPLGERLRDVLLNDATAPGPVAEAYLMTAARAEHVCSVIRPALERGDIVLCDRFSDSTLAYQGAGRGIPLEALRDIQRLAVDGCEPDLKLLLDIDVELGLERRNRDGDSNRMDRESLAFHRRVAEWYRVEAEAHPDDWAVVDAGQSEDAVARRVCEIVDARLERIERGRMAGLMR